MIPQLPCGHQVDETARLYIRTHQRNFYTCRQCQPVKHFMSEPFHWREIVPRSHKPGNETPIHSGENVVLVK